MSYVRWSTPIALPEGLDEMEYFLNSSSHPEVVTSDFYIYDHVGGFVSVNIAGNRHRSAKPFVGPRVLDIDPSTGGGKPNPDWLAWLDEGRERIDHPDAGQSFDFGDMADAIAKVEELISAGFLAPPWLLDAMREELPASGIETRQGEDAPAASSRSDESPVAESETPTP